MYGTNAWIPLIAAGVLIALTIYYLTAEPESNIWIYMAVGALLNIYIVFKRRRKG